MGYDWVEKSTSHIKADDDVDPKQKLTKNQTPYQLKKWDIMKGNNVLIKTGSEYENNIPFALRNNWQRTVNDEDNGLLAYQQEYKQLTDEYDQKVKDRDSKNTPPEQKKVLQSQIDDLWQRIDDKQNELADPQLSKTIGGYMEKIGEHNYRLMQDAAARFGDKMDLRSPDA
ncbi:MAG: hypothetical protein GY947_18635 [Rhodobacteraceae bacterium]|nr:hypothetical protein [Paracoccaceae bacterium]